MDRTNSNTPDSYEEILIELMWRDNVSLSEAMFYDFIENNVNLDSVFDIVDYLEQRLENLDKVQYYMQVFTNQQPDVILKRNDEHSHRD
jgi:hypothetical protein